jgi:hypothetical protein
MLPGFCWTTFDLTTHFPEIEREEFASAVTEADFRTFPRTPILCREEADVVCISPGMVHVTTRPPELGINPPKPNSPLRLIALAARKVDSPRSERARLERRADGQSDVPADRRRPA